jgi:hypothetical protein
MIEYEYTRPNIFVTVVKYQLHGEFRRLVEQLPSCKVVKVIEMKTCELLQYWLECPKETEEVINSMAFMTFIKNPEFQEYYRDTKAFQELIKNASNDID